MAQNFINLPDGHCDTTPQDVNVYYGGGKDGESAYTAALKGGYTGTEAEFYAELAAIDQEAGVPESSETGFVQV